MGEYKGKRREEVCVALTGWEQLDPKEMVGGNSRGVALLVGVVVAAAVLIYGIIPMVVVPFLAGMAVGATVACVGLHAFRPVSMWRVVEGGRVW